MLHIKYVMCLRVFEFGPQLLVGNYLFAFVIILTLYCIARSRVRVSFLSRVLRQALYNMDSLADRENVCPKRELRC